jgi:hypothetical protein
MKKLIGLLSAMLVVSMATVYAQHGLDSARTSTAWVQAEVDVASRSHELEARSENLESRPSDLESRARYAPKDYQAIESWDIPAALRSTLQGYRYRGWKEIGTFYKSSFNRGYILTMGTDNNAKKFYFDRNGNPTNTQSVVRSHQ